MSITKRNPNTIYLGGGLPGGEGGMTLVNDLVTIGVVTPGMLVEYRNDSGTLKWGVHDTADDPVLPAVALEQIELNKGVDNNYAAGDLIKVGILRPGSQFWGLIPSGQNISPGAILQSNGDGKLKAAGTGVKKFVALESSGGAVTADTRLRVEVL